MFKKVCIVPVCYNAYDDARRFLNQLEVAFKNCSEVQLNVVLSDNSTCPLPEGFDAYGYCFQYQRIKNDNIGYFPAFSRAMGVVEGGALSYDYVVVCNVDLVVDGEFLSELVNTVVSQHVGLIAPGIYSDKDGRDLNPKIMRRPKLAKLQFMRVICSSVFLFSAYLKLARAKERLRSRAQRRQANARLSSSAESGSIYGAHGSFMIFTKNYFENHACIDYPRFLFGEEVFVAEQLRLHGLIIKHIPALKISDREHASTSQAKLGFICGEHKKSYGYLIHNFFNATSRGAP